MFYAGVSIYFISLINEYTFTIGNKIDSYIKNNYIYISDVYSKGLSMVKFKILF